jgi:hypothetical protein
VLCREWTVEAHTLRLSNLEIIGESGHTGPFLTRVLLAILVPVSIDSKQNLYWNLCIRWYI